LILVFIYIRFNFYVLSFVFEEICANFKHDVYHFLIFRYISIPVILVAIPSAIPAAMIAAMSNIIQITLIPPCHNHNTHNSHADHHAESKNHKVVVPHTNHRFPFDNRF